MGNIIKEFAEFKELQDTSTWKVSVSSHANMNSLTKELVDKVMDCYHHDEYQDFINTSDKKLTDVQEHPTAIWQIKKNREIETKFFDNFKYTIKDGQVSTHTEFEIKFTNDFDKNDVLDWTEGMNRFCQIHPMTYMRKPKLDDTYQEEKNFLHELRKNQKIKIEQI
jgi:hypothetical protein